MCIIFKKCFYKSGTKRCIRRLKLILEADVNSVEINWSQTNEMFEFILSYFCKLVERLRYTSNYLPQPLGSDQHHESVIQDMQEMKILSGGV